MKGACKTLPVPEQQADAILDQANPVSGTKYVVLDTTANVKIHFICLSVTWTVQPTPLELHVTVDGITRKFTKTDPVSLTVYLPQANPHIDPDSQYLVSTADDEGMYEPLARALCSGRSVKIEAEITGGTVSNLFCRVKYAKW